MSTCTVDGCDKPAHCRGLCSMHYSRLVDWGHVGPAETVRRPAIERLLARITKTDGGCWNFEGPRSGREGYRAIGVNGKKQKAHRVAYEALVGPIPEGLTLDHLCRNPQCVNPDHLEPVDQRTNTLRGNAVSAVNARKTHCVHGHPFDEQNTMLEINEWGNVRRRCRTCFARHRRNYDQRRRKGAR